MKNFKKLFAVCLSTFALSGNVLANELNVELVEINQEVATQIELAVSQINTPAIQETVKLQLEEMTLKQNIEQFLSIARYNEETAQVTTHIISE